MPFTLRNSLGADSLIVDGDVLVAPSGAATTLYAENGTEILDVLNAAGANYLRTVDWAPNGSTIDTLITGDGNDVIIWDAATVDRFDLENLDRARLAPDPARVVEIFDFGAGDDILNLTYIETSVDSPGSYAFDATAYGGLGGDRLAFGTGQDVGFGDDGADSVWGGGGNDTLFGGGGIDSLFGGTGSDAIAAQPDELAADGDYIVGWDGHALSQPVTIALSVGDQVVRDYIDGGITPDDDFVDLDSDTLFMDMPEGVPGARNVLTLSGPGSFSPQIVGIEIIAASVGADVINLSWFEGGQGFAYESDVTVLAGDGNDIVFSGDGHDLIIGDALGGLAGFQDTLFGGRGADTIFGDSDGDGPGGNDSIHGGFGDDTIFGGQGDDTIFDSADGNFFGGFGNDTMFVRLTNTVPENRIDGGPDDTTDGTDGNDHILIGGAYSSIVSELGAGDDFYVALANEIGEGGAGQRVDVVYGGEGQDLIATWYGDDTIYGGADSDVLWGGYGDDLVLAGAGDDLIYAEDGFDRVYGGPGHDYYYVMMATASGGEFPNADIYDEAREGLAPISSNKLILAGAFDSENSNPGSDGLLDGTGIYDLNHDLEVVDFSGDGDIVQLTHLEGTMWQIEHLGNGYIVQFDQRDIDGIALINHDAPAGSTVQYYLWSDEDQTYTYRAT